MKRNLFVVVVIILSLSATISIGNGGKKLASVNGKNITTVTLIKEMEKLPKHLRSRLNNNPGRKILLYGIIVRDLIFQEALGLDTNNKTISLDNNENKNRLRVIKELLESEHIQNYIELRIIDGTIDNNILTDEEYIGMYIPGFKNNGRVRIFDDEELEYN